jgi:hypothetical protein
MTPSSGDRQGRSGVESSRNGALIDSQHFSQERSQQCSQTSSWDGFFGSTIMQWKGLRAPAAHSNTHSNTHRNTHRSSSRPCERRVRQEPPRQSSDCHAGRRIRLRGATRPRPHTVELAERSGIDQDSIRIERGSIFSDEKTLLSLADNVGAE